METTIGDAGAPLLSPKPTTLGMQAARKYAQQSAAPESVTVRQDSAEISNAAKEQLKVDKWAKVAQDIPLDDPRIQELALDDPEVVSTVAAKILKELGH